MLENATDTVILGCTPNLIKKCAGRELSLLFTSGSFLEKSSGPYQSLRETCAALAARGHVLTILGTVGKEENLPEGEWTFAKALPFRRVGPPSWHITPSLRGWLQKKKPVYEVVSIQGIWLMLNVHIAYWAYRRGIPYMITAHGNFNGVALGYSAIKKRIARWCLLDKVFDRAACFQALNEEEYRAIRAYGIDRPVCVIPNGVTVATVHDRDAAEAILPLTFRREKIVLYLGRLHPIKNLEGLIDAWSRLPPDRKGWRLVIAGDGVHAYKRRLEELVRVLNVQGSVTFVGYVDGQVKAAWLRFASVFVLPSFSEGLPMAVLEAMAAGTPVLLTRSCNLAEVAEWGGGKLTEPVPEILARDLLSLMDLDARELELMGERARQLVKINYSWKTVCDQLEEVFYWMKNGGPVPSCVRMR